VGSAARPANADYFTGLAVFFDTYANSRHGYSFPRITAMLGDGKTPADLDGDNARNELAACSKNFRRRNVATKARLTYVKGRGLRLETQLDEWDKWDVCFDAPGAELPASPFVGFTALTGDVADNHDIVGVSVYSATLYEKYRPAQAGGVGAPVPVGQKPLAVTRDHLSGGRAPVKTGGAAGWFLFILKLIGVAAFVAFAVAAYVSSLASALTAAHVLGAAEPAARVLLISRRCTCTII
jgi:mannose-binding lectin 2